VKGRRGGCAREDNEVRRYIGTGDMRKAIGTRHEALENKNREIE